MDTATLPSPTIEQARIFSGELQERKREQVRNEVASEFVEGLEDSFITSFVFPVIEGHMVSVSGESVQEIVQKDYEQACDYASRHPEHSFYARRSYADVELAERVDAMATSSGGINTIVTLSPFPEDVHRYYPKAVVDRNYRPDTRRGLVWLHRKLEGGDIELTSITIDRSNYQQFRQLHTLLSGGEESGAADCESMPHHPIELTITDTEFEEVVSHIIEQSGLNKRDNSIEKAEKIGADLIDFVTEKTIEIEDACSTSHLSEELIQAVREVAATSGSEQVLRDAQVLLSAFESNSSVLDTSLRQALKQCITYSGWAAFKYRLENGQFGGGAEVLHQEIGNIGKLFVSSLQQMPGCTGGLLSEGAVHDAVFIDGQWLSDWGEDKGAGKCVGCEKYSHRRGGCELCVDCHIRSQTNN